MEIRCMICKQTEIPTPKPIKPTIIEIERARQLIKTYEDAIARLTWTRQDFMNKINEIRTKYRQFGIEL